MTVKCKALVKSDDDWNFLSFWFDIFSILEDVEAAIFLKNPF